MPFSASPVLRKASLALSNCLLSVSVFVVNTVLKAYAGCACPGVTFISNDPTCALEKSPLHLMKKLPRVLR